MKGPLLITETYLSKLIIGRKVTDNMVNLIIRIDSHLWPRCRCADRRAS